MRHSVARLAIAMATLLAMLGMSGCGGDGPDGDMTLGTVTDENISYTSDTSLAFTNNKVLLASREGADPNEVRKALAKYGKVDDSNASSGMYAATVGEHMSAERLSALIGEIVEDEPLIQAGSINWSLPDQPMDQADKPSVAPSQTE